jgi:hypothetical protein
MRAAAPNAAVGSVQAAPVAVSKAITTFRRNPPSRYVNREFLGTVTSNTTTALAITSYHINPGMPDTFPWLSQQAKGFEYFIIRRLSVEYVPQCPTSTTGRINMVFDYDVDDAPPQTEAEFLNAFHSASNAIWASCGMRFSPTEQQQKRYYTTDHLPGGSNQLYFPAVLHVAAVGSGVAAVGQLWLDYEIELVVPQTRSVSGQGFPPGLLVLTNGANQSFGNNVEARIQFTVSVNTLGATFDNYVITLPRGNYLMDYGWSWAFDGLTVSGEQDWICYGALSINGTQLELERFEGRTNSANDAYFPFRGLRRYLGFISPSTLELRGAIAGSSFSAGVIQYTTLSVIIHRLVEG